MTEGNVALSAPAEKALQRKVLLRIVPMAAFAYIVSYLDRVTVGYVGDPMSKELGLTASQLGLAAGLFFIPYALLEVPSNLVLSKVGARKWIARILVTWGLVTAVTATVNSAHSLYLVRILLGIAEAGLVPGMMLYFAYWFTRQQRMHAFGHYYLMVPLAVVIGAPLSDVLMAHGPSLIGISGWRTVFLVFGAVTALAGVVWWFIMADGPESARWLSAEESQFLVSRLRAEDNVVERKLAVSSVIRALLDRRVWALSLAYFAVLFGLYPLYFFLPRMIETVNGTTGNSNAVLISAIPHLLGAVALMGWAVAGRRLSATAAAGAPLLVAACGGIAATFTESGWLFVAAVCVLASGIYASVSHFWRLPSLYLTQGGAVAGFALINTIATSSGFFGPVIAGRIVDTTGGFAAILLLTAGIQLAGTAIIAVLGRIAQRSGAAAVEAGSDLPPEPTAEPDPMVEGNRIT